MPTWLHFTPSKRSRYRKKTIPRTIVILMTFCFHFYSMLAPFWGPSWSYVGHLLGTKTLPTRPKTRPGRQLDASSRLYDTPRRPNTRKDFPKTPPRQGTRWDHELFWMNLDQFLMILGLFLTYFWFVQRAVKRSRFLVEIKMNYVKEDIQIRTKRWQPSLLYVHI